jgi:putative addiction module component (TIGR02574 family)
MTDEAMNLSPSERAELVDRLINSLAPIEPDIEAAWTMEAEDRLRAYEAGEIKSTDGDEVLRRIQERKTSRLLERS